MKRRNLLKIISVGLVVGLVTGTLTSLLGSDSVLYSAVAAGGLSGAISAILVTRNRGARGARGGNHG